MNQWKWFEVYFERLDEPLIVMAKSKAHAEMVGKEKIKELTEVHWYVRMNPVVIKVVHAPSSNRQTF